MSEIVIRVENAELREKILWFLGNLNGVDVDIQENSTKFNKTVSNVKEIVLNSIGNIGDEWKNEYGEYLLRKHS
ncbi:MAG: hypothetical protein MR902_05410 [Campylobacter sp.]|nr:hypothetical protein [Campylobacter sp.]